MLELYQFELSNYTEKIRFLLDYKGLDYQKNEVVPGLGQLELLRIAGQRQVPVLKDGAEVIADSTAIALYLEQRYPERSMLPAHPGGVAQCWLMEQWADEVLGPNARKVMLAALNTHPALRTAVLPSAVPNVLKNFVGAVPPDLFNVLGQGVGFGPQAIRAVTEELRRSLTSLCTILAHQPYLIGSTPSLADFAVAGLSMYLKFPAGDYLAIPETLKGVGVPGLADDPEFQPFFQWRDKLYADYRKVNVPPTRPTAVVTPRGPQAIAID